MVLDVALIIALTSIVASSIMAGVMLRMLKEVEKASDAMELKVISFDEITRKASQANVSIADKVLELNNKMVVMEEKVQMAQNMARPR